MIIDRAQTDSSEQAEAGGEAGLAAALVGIATRLISIAPDEVDSLLQQALQIIVRAVGADHGYICQSNEHEFNASYTWHGNADHPLDKTLLQKTCNSWWMEQISDGRRILFHSLPDIPQAAAEIAQALEVEKIKSVLAVPMEREEKVVGFIRVDAVREAPDWDDTTCELLEMTGKAIARVLALKASANYERLARDLSNDLLKLDSVEAVATCVLERLRDDFGYYAIHLYLSTAVFPNLGQADLDSLPIRFVPYDLGRASGSGRRQSTITLDDRRNLVVQAAATGSRVVIGDIRQNSDYLPKPLRPDTRSALALPLLASGQSAGVLQLQHPHSHHFLTNVVDNLEAIASHLTAALIKANYASGTERLRHELQIHQKLAHIVATTASEDELIEQATNLIGDTLYQDSFGFRQVIDPVVGNLRDHPSYRSLPGASHLLRITGPGEGITGRVVVTGQPIRVADTSKEPAYVGDQDKSRSELCVPVIVDGRVIGVLNAEAEHINAYSDADERFLTAVADQLAAAIEKLRLVTDTRRLTEESAALLATTSAISSLQLDNVLNTIAQEARKLLNADSSRIHLLEPGSRSLHCAVALADNAEALRKVTVRLGQGITGSVALSGVAEIVKNSQQDRREPGTPGASDQPEAMALVPLKIRQQVVGVMTVTRRQLRHPFVRADLTLLTAFAEQATIAIENARLFEAERRQLEELRVLHAVATAGSEMTSEAELFEQVTALIGQALYPDNYGFLLLDRTRGVLVTHSSYRGMPGSIQLDQGLVGKAATLRQPFRVNDLAGKSGTGHNRSRTRSQLCVPLLIGEEVIGVINAESEVPNAFGSADQRLLVTCARQLSTVIEKARLFQAERWHASQQEALADAAGRMLLTINNQEIWATASDAAKLTLHAGQVAVYIGDGFPGELAWPHAQGLSRRYMQALDAILEAPYVRQTLARGEPVTAREALAEIASASAAQIRDDEEFQPFAVFPLNAPGNQLGGLFIGRTEPGEFSKDDLAAGQTLAHLVAGALQNTQLFSEKNLALAREQRLNDFTRTLASAMDLPTILASIVRMSAELVEADAGILGLILDNQTMTFYPHNAPPAMALQPSTRRRGLEWHLVESGQSIRLDRYGDHPLARSDWESVGLHGFIGVPIEAGNSRLGTVCLYRMMPEKKFSDRDLALAESLGRQAGIAIQNARLYAEVQQRVDALITTLSRQEETDNAKDQFVQSVTHEVRSPLSIIQGHIELLETGTMGKMNSEQARTVALIARRVQMLREMVDDLYALLVNETQELRQETISATQLIDALLADYEVRVKESGVEMRTVVEPDLPWLVGNQMHLRRVFDNLMDNAFKYTPAGGMITIQAWQEDNTVVIEVADTGVGIAPDEVDRIFDRFYKVSRSSGDREPDGSGLGLAMVKEIVEAHHGHVVAYSEGNEGTAIQVRLPGHEWHG